MKHLQLGKKSNYTDVYNPLILYSIDRQSKYDELGIFSTQLPFQGYDIWNHYEVSWLNHNGKPLVATAQIIYPCNSPNIIESKSLKLYFNSLNQTQFDSVEQLTVTIQKDLTQAVDATVSVHIIPIGHQSNFSVYAQLDGESIDDLDIECRDYQVNPALLTTHSDVVQETLCSDLLKSNCLVTNQPDWGSIQISYHGPKIDREGLLRYIVSYRQHNEFHEQCIERMFIDIMHHCKPTILTVYGRYTRRGGLDINPIRSTHPIAIDGLNSRLIRQ